MKHILFFIGFLTSNLFAIAQNNLTHIVKSGETLSGIAKQYKVSLRELELINNTNEQVIIRPGQKLVIPLGKTANTPKSVISTNATNPTMVSKNQYKVVAGDNMTKIARMFKVQEKQLLEWNNLKTDVILIGQVLYISKPENFTVKKVENTIPKTITKPATKDIAANENTNQKTVEPVTNNIDLPKQQEVVKQSEKVESAAPLKPIIEPKKENAQQTITDPTNATLITSAFENLFTSTGNNIKVKAATFKTGAGWQDKKFYVLSNTIAVGTTVKLNYKNKATFAKVLGTLPQQANEEQVQIRMSTATAASIGAFESTFDVDVAF